MHHPPITYVRLRKRDDDSMVDKQWLSFLSDIYRRVTVLLCPVLPQALLLLSPIYLYYLFSSSIEKLASLGIYIHIHPQVGIVSALEHTRATSVASLIGNRR